jgi:glycosyltransferase involved in cell wall biosynthesis
MGSLRSNGVEAGVTGSPDVHLFEPSGYAGVFQHTCRVAQLLAGAGLRAVVHTGHEHEDLATGDTVELCGCSWWPRGETPGRGRSQRIARRFVTRTLPHLRKASAGDAVVHLQGIAATGALNVAALGAGRLAGQRVVYSPHDTFSRRGRLDGAALRLALRLPHAVIVHAARDLHALRRAGIASHYSPLVQIVPAVPDGRRERWRERWGVTDLDEVVLFAGWIRREKRLDLVIESARRWPANRHLVVVGQDRGAWADCQRLARTRGLNVVADIGFVELDEFVAAISAADVVVAPHERASQSGVLSLARHLGVPAVAADIGGLAELASRTFPPGDVAGLTAALDAALTDGRLHPASVDEGAALAAHLCAYGVLGADDGS